MRDRTSLYYLEKQPQIDELKLHRLLIRPVIWLRQRRRQLHDSRIFDQLTGLMVTADEKRIYEPATKESLPGIDVREQATRNWLFTPATRPERFGKPKKLVPMFRSSIWRRR